MVVVCVGCPSLCSVHAAQSSLLRQDKVLVRRKTVSPVRIHRLVDSRDRNSLKVPVLKGLFFLQFRSFLNSLVPPGLLLSFSASLAFFCLCMLMCFLLFLLFAMLLLCVSYFSASVFFYLFDPYFAALVFYSLPFCFSACLQFCFSCFFLLLCFPACLFFLSAFCLSC